VTLHRFRLEAFETLDLVADAPACRELCSALASEIVARRAGRRGLDRITELVAELNTLGHAFATHKQSDPGWKSWLQHTNDGNRHFYIHVELDDAESVMVLYDETMEAMVARRRGTMSAEDRARDERISSFYDRGLALVDRYDDYADLEEPDRILLCLYLLETGVNNGGFSTYLTNTEGAHLSDAHDFLNRIGAKGLAAIVRDVVETLPSLTEGLTDEVLAALEKRAAQLDDLDGRFYQSEESIAELVLDWLERR
jgi:hypothetical protein